MNPAVTWLIVATILLSLLVIGFLIAATVNYFHNTSSGTGSTGTSLPPCSQVVDTDTLIQIEGTGSLCITNPQQDLYYIGNLGDGKLDYVVAPYGTAPLDVCISFCEKYSAGSCTGADFNGKSAQANFDQCMKQLSSTTCAPPVPLAIKGSTLFYAYLPTCRRCQNCG
jgi:hypothetical protein